MPNETKSIFDQGERWVDAKIFWKGFESTFHFEGGLLSAVGMFSYPYRKNSDGVIEINVNCPHM